MVAALIVMCNDANVEDVVNKHLNVHDILLSKIYKQNFDVSSKDPLFHRRKVFA